MGCKFCNSSTVWVVYVEDKYERSVPKIDDIFDSEQKAKAHEEYLERAYGDDIWHWRDEFEVR